MELIEKMKTDLSEIQGLNDLIEYDGESYIGKPIWIDFKDGSYLHGSIYLDIHWDIDEDDSGELYEPSILHSEICVHYCNNGDVCEEITDVETLKQIDKLIQL